MARIGSYDYPILKITPILESIRQIRDKLKGNTATIDIIASALDYKSANNGAFQHKLGDMRRYGLIDGRGKEIGLSELAKRILVPHPGEGDKAMQEMVFNIPLWREIYERFGKNPDMGVALQKITNADRLEIDSVKDIIGKLYIDAVSKIGNEISNENSGNLNPPNPAQNEPQPSPTNQNVISVRAGDMQLVLPKTDTNIDLIISALEGLKTNPSVINSAQGRKQRKQNSNEAGTS